MCKVFKAPPDPLLVPRRPDDGRQAAAGSHGRGVLFWVGLIVGGWLAGPELNGAVLFQDDFNAGIPGWTAVQPPGAYLDGPLQWQYDIVSEAFVEQSNVYTDNPTYSPTAVAPMLINDTLATPPFTFSARLTAGDDDGFGLIFGYQNETTFYRVTFARQARTGFPWTGWSVDRKAGGVTSNLFGAGTPGYVQTFVNTAGRPFDVTLAVDALNRLTLGVVDNPTGTPTVYALVTDQPLPGPASGRVGLMTWGMAGGTPKGFRIQNVNLTPVPLAGNPNALTNWTPVVPPRANGSTALTGGTGQPFWSLGLGPGGGTGVLLENGDCFGGNDAAGQVDFTGPTLVAGNESWSDYVVAARILPLDDDGHGLILRYLNSTNFYRVALRSQASTIGAPRGLSVQKNVNRTYTEIFRESAVQYDPVAGVPYDLVAAISGDTLQVLLVADPEGAAQAYSYGPWTVSGVPNGRVGVFSWAMSQTEFDWVTVQDGTPLYVSSAHASCSPGRGLNGFTPGAQVTATAFPPASPPGVRITPAGWVGSGSVPASGTGSTLSFRLATFSRLHWLWRTEYQLMVTNGPGGSIVVPTKEWFEAGEQVTLSAQPEPGFAFDGWRGTAFSSALTLSLTMDQPHQLTATFTADTDGDGLPDAWEMACFGSLDELPGGDPDQDGRSNAQEHANGTHPLAADIFRIENLTLSNGMAVLAISNSSGTRFNLERATGLSNGWSTAVTALATNRVVLPVPSEASSYWRLQQPARPPEALPFVPGSWTLVLLPDTQVYAQSYPDLFMDQTRWILENRVRHNIKYVLHLGDITNNNLTNQWANAQAALSLLDGVVPYALVPGNHDYGPNGGTADRTTFLNDYFPVSNFESWPTFGGVKEPGRMDNSYHLFSAGGVDWIILCFEFGPRNSVISWAQSVLDAHPNRRVILDTHAYVYYDDTRYDWASKGATQRWSPYAYGTATDADGTNDAEDLWRKLIKGRPNFVLVVSGHVLEDGLGRLSSTNDFGQVVHQMLVNYQMKTLGGEGFLRLVEFLPDGRTVQVKAYSPFRGTYKTDPENQFTLTLEPPLN